MNNTNRSTTWIAAGLRTCVDRGRIALAVLLSIALITTSACTSLRAVPLSGSSAQTLAVKVGDRVRVTHKDGLQENFAVTAIENDALVGANVRVTYDDIALLEVKRFDKRGTVVLTAILTAAVLFVVAGMVFSAYGELWSGAEATGAALP
jgi:hypothetical protein